MKQLWAPWRMKYILDKKQGRTSDCFLCDVRNVEVSPKSLVLHKNEHAYIVMNKYPYSNGHLLIAPCIHVQDFSELNQKMMGTMMELMSMSTSILRKALGADGFNMGANIGRCAGAGEEHLHIHILPRWNGDTNFMPFFSDTRVINEYLEETYEKLFPLFQNK